MTFIHSTATVDVGAKIGAYTSIWHYCHIEANAKIGENCNLGQNVYVGNEGVMGNGCRIGNSVSVFSHVTLDDFVFCAPFMVFTHISFPRASVSRRNLFARTFVGKGATLGANSTILPGITIGEGTFVGAAATLTRSTTPWSLMIGSPARQVGWVSAYGDKIPLPLSGVGEWVCPFTKDRYVLEGSTICRHPGPIDILEYHPGQKLTRVLGSIQ